MALPIRHVLISVSKVNSSKAAGTRTVLRPVRTTSMIAEVVECAANTYAGKF